MPAGLRLGSSVTDEGVVAASSLVFDSPPHAELALPRLPHV
jgi:hypothetical protein